MLHNKELNNSSSSLK